MVQLHPCGHLSWSRARTTAAVSNFANVYLPTGTTQITRRLNLPLEKGTNAIEAGVLALPVIKRLVFLIQQQVDAMSSLPIPKKAKA